MNPIRVLLADDHGLVRAGIRSLLEKMQGVEVVGEASNGREALALATSELPNLVLMDIEMPDLSGLEVLPRIVKTLPSIKVAILSAYATEQYVSRALRSGASGYMLKHSATAELELLINSVVVQERIYLSPLISRIILNNYMQKCNSDRSLLEGIAARQREILQMIAEGKKTKDIAYRLGVSVKTVETHRLRLMARLDIHDMPGLVRYAIRSGLVSPDT